MFNDNNLMFGATVLLGVAIIILIIAIIWALILNWQDKI